MQVKNNVGFTLIELLVVVLIIGILAAVALPQYTKAVEKSRATEAMQILGDLATAESIYYMTNGSYTSNAGMLDLEFPNISAGATNSNIISGKSYDITLSVDDTSKGFIATANRNGGAYADGKLAITVSTTGAIERKVNESDVTETQQDSFKNIVSQLWKN